MDTLLKMAVSESDFFNLLSKRELFEEISLNQIFLCFFFIFFIVTNCSNETNVSGSESGSL